MTFACTHLIAIIILGINVKDSVIDILEQNKTKRNKNCKTSVFALNLSQINKTDSRPSLCPILADFKSAEITDLVFSLSFNDLCVLVSGIWSGDRRLIIR